MLRYMAHGWRSFNENLDVKQSRLNWEFFAVLKGSCAPYFFDKKTPILRKSTLWLLPPKLDYVWVGGKKCAFRVVFQLGHLPAIMSQRLSQQDKTHYEIPITKEQGYQILKLAKEIKDAFYHPDETYDIRVNKLSSELCLIILGSSKNKMGSPLHLAAMERVLKAENFYRENLSKHFSVADIAEKMRISEGHLRRLFHEVRKKSPQETFRLIRLNHCVNLLSCTNFTNDEIAEKSGFTSLVDFYRTFKKEYGVTPHYWRTRTLLPEKNPYNFSTLYPPSLM